MQSRTMQTLRVYWQSARHYKALMSFMIAGLTAAVIAELAVPLYYKQFFDLLAASGGATAQRVDAMWNIILIVTAVNAVSWVLYRSVSWANDYFQPRMMTDLTQSAFEYLCYHSFGFFSNSFVGSLVKRITRLSRSFEQFADKVYWSLYPLLIRIIGVVVVLWSVHRTIGIVLMAWIFLFLGLNVLFARWKYPYDRERSELDSKSTGALADAITNNVNIRLFGGFREEFARYSTINERLRRMRTFTWNLGDVIEAIQGGLMIAVEFGLMVIALRYWKAGELSVGTFVLIQAYLVQLFIRLWDFGRVIRELYESFSEAEEMVEILNTPHEIVDIPRAKTLSLTRGEIRFERVKFSYHQTRRVLHGIDLTIRPGEKVALIGPSGSGKTTIIKLLFRLYDIDEGKILIDGQKIHAVTQESLHEALSLVPQDPMLFHRSLMENIRYGRREATDEEVMQAAKLAHCHEFIQEFHEQYQTFVGERGVKLSGGERQRVAIARAILRNASILVLDEATSSLDSESESLIQDALKTLMKGKTSIVIAHRLSTIQQMDRIIVLDQGRIVEEGTHKKLLLRKKSLYRKLWELQAGGFLVEEEGGE